VAERAGHRLFGFPMELLALTVPHFHYAGFAAALVAGLVCRTVPGRTARLAAWSVPAGTGLVFAGYFVNDATELAGAVVLTAGMWLVGWLTWREVRPRATSPITRWCFGIAAAVLVLTMLLALDWAVGHVSDLPHLSLFWMVATHGVGNALGFGLCGVAAWHRLREETR
ncbi:MAG: YndJ family protein, partial [Micromonosporaceae bacterium]